MKVKSSAEETMNDIARGLEGIVAAATRLSHIDGERGELLLAGYAVDEIAPQATFEDMLHLLWHDRLPKRAEAAELRRTLAVQRGLPAATLSLLRDAAGAGLPVMDALRVGVGTLTLAVGDSRGPEAQTALAAALVARFPTIIAAYWRLRGGLPIIDPEPTLGHVANYLYMLRGVPPHPAETRALETYFNTVVDHGMNASTFAARVIVSTRSDMISALEGAVGALKGPLHGGAPGPALDMVFEIRERAGRTGNDIEAEAERWIRQAFGRGERLMGFGHRVYKVRDPRADVLAAAATQLFDKAGDRDLYRDACTVEKVALRLLREAKPDRRLDTNVEYYTALLLHGIGLDADLFSPTFAAARCGGWTAHVLEQIAEDHIIRPTALYVGKKGMRWPAAGLGA
jgi:citrate synthase